MPKLIVSTPTGQDETLDMTEDSAIIGRAPECTVHLEDPSCSRRHCQIIRVKSGFELVDLQSRNGTKVNGHRTGRKLLADGDTIEIGDARIVFRDGAAAREEEIVLEDVGKSGSGGGARAGAEEGVLVFTDGNRKGERIALSSSRTTFGRKDSNSVVLKDPMASSYHCEITREGGGYVLRDLGSTNGTLVDGEMVSETTLSHGAKIRMGKTRFAFVDPTVADFEKALAEEEEAESEWGLMRTQVDLARVKRARRATVLWVVVFILVFGGAGAFVALRPQKVKDLLGLKTVAEPKDVPGNRLTDPSFEEHAVAWTTGEDGVGHALIEAGPSHQGTSSLLLQGPESGDRPAVAGSAEEVDVAAGRNYEVSIWADPSHGTLARAGVEWLRGEDGAGSTSIYTPFAAPGRWTMIHALVTPPSGVDRCRVVVTVVGPGSCRFDDVAFRQVSSPAPAGKEYSVGSYRLRVGARGDVSVEGNGSSLVWEGGVALVTKGGDVVFGPESFEVQKQETGGGEVTLEGVFRMPGGKEVPVSFHAKENDEGMELGYELHGAPGVAMAGIGFMTSQDYLSRGATYVASSGTHSVRRTANVEGVDKLILGGQLDRLSLRSGKPCELRVVSRAKGLLLAFLAPAGDKAGGDLEVVADFAKERQAAASLLAKARSAADGGQLGQAVELYTRIVGEYPFDGSVKAEAEKHRTELLDQAQSRLQEARSLFEGAKDFFDRGDLDKALAKAKSLESDYAGLDSVTKEASSLDQDVSGVLDGLKSAREEVEAGSLLSQAEDFAHRKESLLATRFYEMVVSRYPETKAAAAARKALDALSK